MNTFKKEIKNNDKTVDIVFAKSCDNYDVMIGDNYKLIKFNNKRTFSDSLFGANIGIGSRGFASVMIISTIIAIIVMGIILNCFRI